MEHHRLERELNAEKDRFAKEADDHDTLRVAAELIINRIRALPFVTLVDEGPSLVVAQLCDAANEVRKVAMRALRHGVQRSFTIAARDSLLVTRTSSWIRSRKAWCCSWRCWQQAWWRKLPSSSNLV